MSFLAMTGRVRVTQRERTSERGTVNDPSLRGNANVDVIVDERGFYGRVRVTRYEYGAALVYRAGGVTGVGGVGGRSFQLRMAFQTIRKSDSVW